MFQQNPQLCFPTVVKPEYINSAEVLDTSKYQNTWSTNDFVMPDVSPITPVYESPQPYVDIALESSANLLGFMENHEYLSGVINRVNYPKVDNSNFEPLSTLEGLFADDNQENYDIAQLDTEDREMGTKFPWNVNNLSDWNEKSTTDDIILTESPNVSNEEDNLLNKNIPYSYEAAAESVITGCNNQLIKESLEDAYLAEVIQEGTDMSEEFKPAEGTLNELILQKKKQAMDLLNGLGYLSIPVQRNMKTVHVCSLCDKEFKFKSLCDNHAIKSHSGIKYSCFNCEKSYLLPTSLQAHLKRCSANSGDKQNNNMNNMYECEIPTPTQDGNVNNDAIDDNASLADSCFNDSFTTASFLSGSSENEKKSPKTLTTKERTRRESKPIAKNKLKAQIATTLEKIGYKCIVVKNEMDPEAKPSYICSACQKAFSCRGECNRHAANVHTGIRYQCPTCFKTTSCPGSLRRHIDCYHTPSNKPKCPYCSKVFVSTESMTKHIKVKCKFLN